MRGGSGLVTEAVGSKPLRGIAPIFAAAMMLGFSLAGCASGENPAARLAVARAAITDAEAAGATDRAPAELSSARDKLRRAEAAAQVSHYDEAGQLAQEAEVDAQLATVKSRLSAMRTALTAIERGDGGPVEPAPATRR